MIRECEDNIYKNIKLNNRDKYFILNSLDHSASIEQTEKLYALVDGNKLNKMTESSSIERTNSFLLDLAYRDYQDDKFYKNSTNYLLHKIDGYFRLIASNYLLNEINNSNCKEIKQILKEEFFGNISNTKYLEDLFLSKKLDRLKNIKGNVVDSLKFFDSSEFFIEDVLYEYTRNIINSSINNLIYVPNDNLRNPNYKAVSIIDYCYLKTGLVLSDDSYELSKQYFAYYKKVLSSEEFLFASENIELVTSAFRDLPKELKKYIYQKKS